jgi:NarL family two-component system response regulator LiaR
VLIVDDHQMVRRGLDLFLRGYPDIVVVGEAENGEEAIRLCGEVQPDVVLMDIIMPIMNGVEATRVITQTYPGVQIIALSSSSETEHVKSAVQAGATSYLLKTVSDDQLTHAIRAAQEGQGTLSREATQALINATKYPTKSSYNLSERELEILGWMVEGLDNPAIAEKVCLSRSTIKYHISSIFTKLKVSNRSEAISLTLKNDLLTHK